MNNILIYGPPASGKSTIGKALAKSLNLEFIDLDAEIERRAGETIQDIFSRFGEVGFRQMESDVFQDIILSHQYTVISLGGGTLLDSDSRKIAEKENTVLYLDHPQDRLDYFFTHDAKNKRPLCQKQDLRQYHDLLNSRKNHYQSFKTKVSSINFDPDPSIQNGLSDIFIGLGIIETFVPTILAAITQKKKVFIVYDKNVKWIFDLIISKIPGYDVKRMSFKLKASETNKSMTTVHEIHQRFLDVNLTRSDIVISIGGGITSDVVGFASSCWKRGIKWISIPTTLTSIVDASVGGKTGVNMKTLKNIIGAFHKPAMVLIDPNVLRTLPVELTTDGMSEAYKHFLLDPMLKDLDIRTELNDLINNRLNPTDNNYRFIGKMVGTKLRIVKSDPLETLGIRDNLNLGHTIAHAIEAKSKGKISHGKAVAIGLCKELELSYKHGILNNPTLIGKVKDDMIFLQMLNEDDLSQFDVDDLLKYMVFDKKNISNRFIKFIFLQDLQTPIEFFLQF